MCMPAAKEFTPVKDPQDGYSFVYPFGWQEVPLWRVGTHLLWMRSIGQLVHHAI